MAVWIVEALRTPIATANPSTGLYKDLRSDTLAGKVIRSLTHSLNNKVAFAAPDEVVWGVSRQEGEQGYNLARQASLEGGLSISVPALTICRNCSSGLDAILIGQALIESGRHQVVIAGGVEHMGHVPLQDPQPGPVFLERFGPEALQMVKCAEHLAKRYGISRQQQDSWSHLSHLRAVEAVGRGDFQKEITPIKIPGYIDPATQDQTIRFASDLEKLSTLQPLDGADGTVTAGNASPVNVGAAGVVLASDSWVKERGLKPIAKLLDGVAVGLAPLDMGLGPVLAIRALLEHHRMGLDAVRHIEVNEAFAAQVLAVIGQLQADPARVNPLGGAIALGHPLGASGARLVVTLAHALSKGNGFGLASLCVGGGQGAAALLASPE